MKTNFKLAFAVSLLALVAVPSIGAASFYPPDYVVSTQCQTSGPVEVCAMNHRFGSYPQIRVTYRGYLMEKSWGHISAYVKFNGRDGVFPMTNSNYAEHLTVGDPKSYLCYTVPTGPGASMAPPYGAYNWCHHTTTDQSEPTLTWEVEPLPPEESSLFFYARDQFGMANDWDIEVALVSDDGRWDSQYGYNYRFRFDADSAW